MVGAGYDARSMFRNVSVLLLIACPLAAEPLVFQTEHYRVEWGGARGTGEEYARLLEAAWPQYAKFFGAEPKLKEGERLRVRYFTTRERWVKALMADRAIPPGKAGGYYWPSTKTAYVFQQPTRSYTRTLLLHEAAHQFHYLARTKNKNPGLPWYTEGVAEYLAEHFWDGEKLELAVVQLVTLKDYPTAALATLKGGELVLDKKTPRPVGWALVRYLATKPHRRFKSLRKKFDAGAVNSFEKTIGRPKKVGPQVAQWLDGQQEPWAQVFNEWNGVGPKSIRGFAGVVSLCRIKQPTNELAATLIIPKDGRFKAGVVLEFKSPKDYTIALLDQRGTLHIQRRRDGRWKILERHDTLFVPKNKVPFVVARSRRGVSFTVCGKTFGPWESEGTTFGLALEACDVTFVDLEWR